MLEIPRIIKTLSCPLRILQSGGGGIWVNKTYYEKYRRMLLTRDKETGYENTEK